MKATHHVSENGLRREPEFWRGERGLVLAEELLKEMAISSPLLDEGSSVPVWPTRGVLM